MNRVPEQALQDKILSIRGQRVMIDSDLASLYGVEVKTLNQAVRRNLERFPDDFMFQLTPDEYLALRSQFVTLKPSQGKHRKYAPLAFTEQGIAMLSSVLRSKTAIQVNIEIMRLFVRLKRMLDSNKELAQKLENLEKKYDSQFRVVFDAIRKLMEPAPSRIQKKPPIGIKW